MMLSEVAFRPPRIETARVVLRGYEASDAEAIYAYSSDQETTRFMAWERAITLDDVHRFLNMVVSKNYQHGALEYAVTLRGSEHQCVGGMGVYWRPREHQVMELGYILNREYWGRALIPEAGRALLAHVFGTTEVERVYAPILGPNTKSRRTAEKLGMRLDGVLRSNLNLHGERWDEAIYSILRDEFWFTLEEQARLRSG
jgi:ribosomal-protein-alanine N-acetyltransferase